MNEPTATRTALLTAGALVLCSLSLSAMAQAPNTNTNGYWVNSSGQVWKNGYGQCWRAGYWTPAMAIAECDPDLMPKVAQASAPVPPPARAVLPPPPPPAAAPPVVQAPKPAAVIPVTEKITLQADALFDFDKAVIRPDAKANLDTLVSQLKAVNLEVVIVVGHTDRMGSDAYNMKLSSRRAEAVKAYLINRGIPANRVTTEGRGESQPVKQCTETKRGPLIACLQPNRRVQVEVIGTRQR